MEASQDLVVVSGGFALAFVFGLVASKSNFCTMGAISDVVNMGHWGRMRMWLLAIAVAILGANALALAGLVDLSKTFYQQPRLNWLSLVVGGAVFGVGMSLAGGCANKNLIRVGAGSLRSFVVLTFLGISAYTTMRGLFGQWRVTFLDPVSIDLSKMGLKTQSVPTVLAATGISPQSAVLISVGVVVGGLLIFVFSDKRFRANSVQWLGGIALGAVVACGWYVSGHLGFGENPNTLEMGYAATNSRTLESLTFVAPLSYGLELLLLWTDKSLHLTFGIAAGLGVVLGSAAYALFTRTFHWEGFASFADLRNQILGAVLMGFGGVTALGCTVGQGLSGLSTLSIGSLIATASIVAGAAATLKYISWQAERED